MGKRSPKNYCVVLLMFVATSIFTYWFQSNPTQVLFSANLSAVPLELEDWHGTDLEIEESVMEILDADSVLSRRYVSASELGYVDFLVVYRKYGRRDFYHRPELCYPASGWKIAERTTTNLQVGDKQVEAIKVLATKDDAKEIVLYWFASGERTEAHYTKQQLMMALDRLQTRKYGWSIVRMNSPVVESEEETMKRLRKFTADISGPLVTALTTDGDTKKSASAK